MPNDYAYCPDGVQLENRHVNQILLDLTGKLAQGIPKTFRGSSGQALMIIDDSGVRISRDGVEAPTSPYVPIGGAILWTRPVAEIPAGWAVCDGTSGTPDFRDRFILGAGTIAAGTTGGVASQDISHSHTSTATHVHTGAVHTHTTNIDHDHGGFKTTADDSAHLTSGDRDRINVTSGSDFLISGGDHRHWIDVPQWTQTDPTSTNPSAASTGAAPAGTTDASGSTTLSTMPPFYSAVWIRRQV